MLSGHGAVPVQYSILCCPGFKCGSDRKALLVKSQHCCRHRLLPRCLLPQCHLLLPRKSPQNSGTSLLSHISSTSKQMVRNNKLQKLNSKQRDPRTNKAASTIYGRKGHYRFCTCGRHMGTETTNRAACTIDYIIDGYKGALSLTSLMDTTEEGEQNNLKRNNSINNQMG